MFPAHEPNTVMIANGLAGMGFAVPCAVAAKLVHPGKRVVTVSGDGGILMNFQEFETAMRLKTPFVNVVWENRQFGSIVWKQDKKFGEHFGVDFTNPDFVKLAEAFGMPAWRCQAPDDFGKHLRHALTLDLPSLIVLPIDYSMDVAFASELGDETVANTCHGLANLGGNHAGGPGRGTPRRADRRGHRAARDRGRGGRHGARGLPRDEAVGALLLRELRRARRAAARVHAQVADQARDAIVAAVAAHAAAGGGPRTSRWRYAAVGAFTAFLEEDPRRGRVLLSESFSDTVLARHDIELVPAFAALLVAQITALPDGPDEVDAELTAVALIGALRNLYLVWMEGRQTSTERLNAHAARLIIAAARVSSRGD